VPVVIGINGSESKADLVRHISVSRARVTQILKRLANRQDTTRYDYVRLIIYNLLFQKTRLKLSVRSEAIESEYCLK
jgi:hypothetical protein